MKKITEFLLVEKKDDVYTIRMTPELQDDLGTIGFAQFYQVEKVDKGDIIMKVEASKAIVNVKMPISGTVVEKNMEVLKNPQLLNSASENDNWIVRLTDVNEQDYNALEDY
ncbi:glycine cleavage system protein H [Mycoplasma phocoenae]|uniref:Glycine cleavage system protein H n=1 Tax=Mycoplasma phocoenae TaxID=754517 RepID=A0A858U8L5_9MOLU|nr:glycine cleavage system protein H [Mycoplasma phocoenae]QJG67056.1 glycine cleavage system protein H [Mycoplasma phocoenae]